MDQSRSIHSEHMICVSGIDVPHWMWRYVLPKTFIDSQPGKPRLHDDCLRAHTWLRIGLLFFSPQSFSLQLSGYSQGRPWLR